MTHRNAPLTPQGRYRLVMRVQAGRPGVGKVGG